MKISELNAIKSFFSKTGAYTKRDGDYLTINNSDVEVHFKAQDDDPELWRLDAIPVQDGHNADGLFQPCNKDAYGIDRKSLEFVAIAAAKKDIRYYLKGLAFYKSGAIAATDGHRLHFNGISSDYTESDDPLLVPIEVVNLALKLSSNGSALSFLFGSGSVEIYTNSGAKIRSRLVDGKYPNIDRVIPKKLPYYGYFESYKKVIGKLCQRAKIESGKDCTLIIDEAGAWLPKSGAVSDTVFSTPVKMGFNANYLKDAAITGDGFTLYVPDNGNESILMQCDGNLSAVIMPTRL